MRYPVVVQAMAGLGDTVYQRAFIRALVEQRREPVYVRTPWPEFFGDMPEVRCIYSEGIGLRTQEKNAARHVFERGPLQSERIRPRYGLRNEGDTIVRELTQTFGLRRPRLVFDLPDFGKSPVGFKKPVAVVRPVTLRKEWHTPARAPLPEYVAEAAKILQARGFAVVVVADTAPGEEWTLKPMPVADKYFLKGELPVEELMALVQRAAVVVGGVGWIVPVGVASRTPTIVIGGGLGGHNAPDVITDACMDLSRVRFVLPEPYCRCRVPAHACPKLIPEFAVKFGAALDDVAPQVRPRKRRKAAAA